METKPSFPATLSGFDLFLFFVGLRLHSDARIAGMLVLALAASQVNPPRPNILIRVRTETRLELIHIVGGMPDA